MQAPEKKNSQKNKELPKQKTDRYNWWQTVLILVSASVIFLSTGYFISQKYLWKDTNSAELQENIRIAKAEVKENPNEASIRIKLGYAYFLNKDYDKAISQYKTAKNLEDDNFDAYINLSIVYEKQKNTQEALEMALKAIEIVPLDYKGQLLAGRNYRKLEMFSEATTALDEALRLKPGNTDIVYEIGLIAEDQGKMEDAVTIYKEALTFDPLYKPALNALDRLASTD